MDGKKKCIHFYTFGLLEWRGYMSKIDTITIIKFRKVGHHQWQLAILILMHKYYMFKCYKPKLVSTLEGIFNYMNLFLIHPIVKHYGFVVESSQLT